MKKALFFAFILLSVNACFAQGFDKDMLKAGKEFHKHSKRVGQNPPKKTKRVSTLDGNKKMKKKNRARQKSSPAKKD